jgi:hypothetical protein
MKMEKHYGQNINMVAEKEPDGAILALMPMINDLHGIMGDIRAMAGKTADRVLGPEPPTTELAGIVGKANSVSLPNGEIGVVHRALLDALGEAREARQQVRRLQAI